VQRAFVRVADDGHGMDQATRERIFEPFFTTKDVGQGTGLGLSVAHGIVQDHGGSIEVESRPQQGSRFSVYLPMAST
jgi:signal transduction histidine kinase